MDLDSTSVGGVRACSVFGGRYYGAAGPTGDTNCPDASGLCTIDHQYIIRPGFDPYLNSATV